MILSTVLCLLYSVNCPLSSLVSPYKLYLLQKIKIGILKLYTTGCLLLLTFYSNAQSPVYSKFASQAGRQQFMRNVLNNNILKNLQLPLSDSTEEDWQGSFWAMELLQYRQPWVLRKIDTAFMQLSQRSLAFQRALLELSYTNYPTQYSNGVTQLQAATADPKLFAMCDAYLSRSKAAALYKVSRKKTLAQKFPALPPHPIIRMMQWAWQPDNYLPVKKILPHIFSKDYLPGQVLLISLQRKNRDYPGIVLVRDTAGNFLKTETGTVFHIQQLARSITNLPSYLTNGNTPQGLFRMNGFDVSSSNFIGPTENIQLMMPYETSPPHFLQDSTITDTLWSEALYKRLLPKDFEVYLPLWHSYYASQAGRTEIIAHGTTIDPAYYKDATYFPHTPTLGCLCTKEIWAADGKRTVSNQQVLADAVKRAGGAQGWLLVLELDNTAKPVSLSEVMPFIKTAVK